MFILWVLCDCYFLFLGSSHIFLINLHVSFPGIIVMMIDFNLNPTCNLLSDRPGFSGCKFLILNADSFFNCYNMKVNLSLLLLVCFFYPTLLLAQQDQLFTPENITQRLRNDIETLAADSMEGREAGTPGEWRAALFLKQEMKNIGLEPLFEGSFLQDFTFPGEWVYGEDNYLIIDGEEFSMFRDFFVLPNSYSAQINAPGVYVGYGLKQEGHNDYEGLADLNGKVFFMEYFLPTALDVYPGNQPLEILQNKIDIAIEKGALAVIFVNSSSDRRDPSTSLNQRMGREQIPVLFATQDVLHYWQQLDGQANILLSTQLERESHTAWNVAGYIDNQAEYTVVIGAHYDHLGFGGRGSRSPGVNAVHYGADDNASGTAGVLESARFLMSSGLDNHNYIFIGFSAEEKGLLGSRYFTQSNAYDMSKINFMFNYDMIGRMSGNTFTLIGTGSSPVWDTIIDQLAPDGYNVRKSVSGVGGSDHTNFYREGIPVLFFFTGIHEDYHRPSDTPDKINYPGMLTILDLSHQLIAALNEKERLPFSETPASARSTSRRSGPVLGLMPDHSFDGVGMKIQAVTQNNPAQRAGMQSGDIIVRVGETRVSDIQTYMQAMAGLQTNQKVKVAIIRNGSEMEMDVDL